MDPAHYEISVFYIFLTIFLVALNGFFVAAEFAMVRVRGSQIEIKAKSGSGVAKVARGILHNLDGYLAATQLGITISSLALGWVGEPALAHLVEPLLVYLPGDWVSTASHTIAVVISFVIITALHIVLGELAPKSLALQRSELTALAVVRPLGLFLLLLRPAIMALNGMGNLVLRLVGLKPGTGESSFHSTSELKLLVAESQEAGLLDQAQQQIVERIFNIGDRQVADIMTQRLDVNWVDANDSPEEILRTIRECPHEQLLVGRDTIDEPIGMVLKKDILDQLLDGKPLDPLAVIREPLVIHESTKIFRLLDRFKTAPVRLAMVIDEYGSLQGIVTQTDLLEAIAGDLPGSELEEPDVVERQDGSLLIEGLMPVRDALERIGISEDEIDGDFHTFAGFALHQLGRLPVAGDFFDYDGWHFEVVDMDGRRIDKILAKKIDE